MTLKRTYPDRVHIVLGNRDLNKIRFLNELQESSLMANEKVYFGRDFSQHVTETPMGLVERTKLVKIKCSLSTTINYQLLISIPRSCRGLWGHQMHLSTGARHFTS